MQESLFGKKGVIPNLQNSAEWQARFLALQKDLAGSRWEGPVKKAVKHMSFAKQRWNSEDEPRRRFAAMIVPIALLLAIQSEDSRQSLLFRQRCEETLQRLEPKFLIDLGLSSDYSNELLSYLRIYDADIHDAAVTLREKSEFESRSPRAELEK